MYISKLSLSNFKNHHQLDIFPCTGINAIVGENGVGKTNILLAISYLSIGKNIFGGKEEFSIMDEASFLRIYAMIDFPEYAGKEIELLLNRDRKKTIRVNGKIQERITEFIGNIPSVFISPYDVNLINETSDVRRKFLDSAISISANTNTYLQALVRYTQNIKQRNALLKDFQKHRYFEESQLELYTEFLSKDYEVLSKKRIEFLHILKPYAQEYYEIISGGKEKIDIIYVPSFDLDNESLEEAFHTHLQKDLALGYTSVGAHKDDIIFKMNGDDMRKRASQGQQKSFLIALKLAQAKVVLSQKTVRPILLLDDIFDKLDSKRVKNLIQLVQRDDFGQIFISDTDEQRILALEDSCEVPLSIIHLPIIG